MKVQRTRWSAAKGGRTGMSGQRVLMAEAALAGGVVLAFLLWELPSLRREARIWRMAGGFRAGHRYP